MTYEQIQKFPVGTIYHREEHINQVTGYWYTAADKFLILTNPKLFDVTFNSDYSYTAYTKNISENKIDGWLFDGKEWHCTELTWDGHQEIDDEELLEIEI